MPQFPALPGRIGAVSIRETHAGNVLLTRKHADPNEATRRRRDTKVRDDGRRSVAQQYRTMLWLTNKTWGHEGFDILEAFRHAEDPLHFAVIVAHNEAIDRIIAAKGEFLKRNVYRKPWYRLPVGIEGIPGI